MSVEETLLEFINSLEIIDTHEHLPNEHEWAAKTHDVLAEFLTHYFSCDVVSAGLPQKVLDGTVRDSSQPLMERWGIVEPYWNDARNTGYGRCLDIVARDLYGLPGVNRDTIQTLNEEFLKRRAAAAKGKSYYRFVLKEKSKIITSLNDELFNPARPCDKDYFREVYRLEGLIDLADPVQLEKLGDAMGIRIHSLEDYRAAVEAGIEKAIARGAVALKAPFAYSRPIRFAKTAAADAEREFNALFSGPSGPESGPARAGRPFALEDYLMHCAMRLADKKGLTVQIHTGLQEGNGNVLSNSNPELLTNLFLEYRNVTFDIFHISYPWQNVLAALAKNFQNVNIDFCWVHIISPEAAVRALLEMLDSVPANKISAFGGDFILPDGVYGHQYLARRNVAKALAIKVSEGTFDVDRAKEIAKWVFVDNPKRIFKLKV